MKFKKVVVFSSLGALLVKWEDSCTLSSITFWTAGPISVVVVVVVIGRRRRREEREKRRKKEKNLWTKEKIVSFFFLPLSPLVFRGHQTSRFFSRHRRFLNHRHPSERMADRCVSVSVGEEEHNFSLRWMRNNRERKREIEREQEAHFSLSSSFDDRFI